MSNEKLKLLGTLASLYPAWVRSVCRSHVCPDEDELLEIWRRENIHRLEDSPYFGNYHFLKKHADLLRTYDVLKTRDLLERCRYNHVMAGCEFANPDARRRGARNKVCIGCPVILEYFGEVMHRGVEEVPSDESETAVGGSTD